MESKEFPIGVFDSGIGGLTVVRELLRELPDEEIVYFGDTARVPYGSKSPRVVREFALQDAGFLISMGAKIVVVACNTASAEGLDLLRESLDVPVVGVIEPGARAAVELTSSGRIGVIGTHGTVASRAYEKAIKQLDGDIKVAATPCPLFVPLVEEGWQNKAVAEEIAAEYLKPLLDLKVDTLILGCTHYPLLMETLRNVTGGSVALVDSAVATAEATSTLLMQEGLSADKREKAPTHRFYVSDMPFKFGEMGSRFLGRELPHVTVISLDTLEGALPE